MGSDYYHMGPYNEHEDFKDGRSWRVIFSGRCCIGFFDLGICFHIGDGKLRDINDSCAI
jgi:hypothetical protein